MLRPLSRTVLALLGNSRGGTRSADPSIASLSAEDPTVTALEEVALFNEVLDRVAGERGGLLMYCILQVLVVPRRDLRQREYFDVLGAIRIGVRRDMEAFMIGLVLIMWRVFDGSCHLHIGVQKAKFLS
jgi:hypothetical protein